MADHDTLQGRDLHEPSNTQILNNTGSFIPVGSFVPLNALKNSDGQRPVTRLAMEGEIPVGYVSRAIATGDTDSVLVFGPLEPFNTEAFSVGDLVQVNSTGDGLIITTGAGSVGRVTLKGIIGSINFNGLHGVDAGAAGTAGCSLSGGLSTNDLDWNTTPTSNNNGSIFFNQDNGGFTWLVTKGAITLRLICDGISSDPLPAGGALTGDISLTQLLLNGTQITPDSATYDSMTDILTIVSNTQLVNPDLDGTSNTFTLDGTFTIGQESGLDLNTTLTYRSPSFNINNIRTNPFSNRSFNSTFTAGRISRNIPSGNTDAVLTTSTFGGTDISSMVSLTDVDFTFPVAINHNTSTANRLLSESITFTNRFDNTDTRVIADTDTLFPGFFYEVYTGSITVTEESSITATLLNSSRFTRNGTFTSTPSNQNFTWTNPEDPTPLAIKQSTKVLAVATRFTNGGDIIVRDSAGAFPSIISRNSQVAIGDISGATENYDIYIVKKNINVGITLFVEL